MAIRGGTGRITKIVSSRYEIATEDGKTAVATARGKLRLNGELYVGDNVRYAFERGTAVITEMLPRKNSLIRPFVANVDTCIIVVAKVPEPDMLLVDKIILNCHTEGIRPVLCYNKSDLAEEGEIDALFAPYKDYMECISVSAERKTGFDELSEVVKGKTVCFAGQSAVGKTSLLNAILDLNLKTDGLSKKIKRGKNTTRHVEIYPALGGYIVDTCGFSMLTITDIKPEELIYYYADFLDYQDDCKYRGCTHTDEPECAVKKAVADGKIEKSRYERYLTIYQELKEYRRKLYD